MSQSQPGPQGPPPAGPAPEADVPAAPPAAAGQAPGGHAPGGHLPPPAGAAGSGTRQRAGLLVAAGVLAAAGLAIAGIVPRIRAESALARKTAAGAVASVQVFVPRAAGGGQEIVLPGNVQAFEEAPIFARTNGYLRRWYADIGARVQRGQLLAEIETPEVDRQLDQARADLGTATANSELANILAARYTELRKTDSVSQQDLDNALGDAKAKKAMVNSAQANVNRLEQLQSFEKIYAPFDGVVTARNTDVGQLIDSGSGAGPAKELFHVAAISTLRVFVNVPQVYSQSAHPGTSAYLTLAEAPGKRFTGKLVRNANAIDQASRTLLAEVDVDNRGGELLPGAYAQVHLDLTGGARALLVPVSAFIFQSEGLRLAVVDDANRVHLTQVTPGRDFGTAIEVLAGLATGQRVVDNPPDSLVEGQQVHILQSRAGRTS